MSSGAPMRPLTPSCWKEYASRGVSLRRVTRSTPSLSVWRLVTRRAASCICSAAAVVGTGDGGGFSDQGYEFQSRRVIVRLDPRGRRDAEDGRDRADDRSPGRCEEDAPFWSSPPSPGRAMSPASVGAYIAAAPTAFQKRAPFADPATRSRPIDDRERGPSLFVYARFAYGRNRLLRVASALASREARVSRCADRQRKGNQSVWRQK